METMDDDLDWSGISAYKQDKLAFFKTRYRELFGSCADCCCGDCCNPEPKEYTHIKLEIHATRPQDEN